LHGYVFATRFTIFPFFSVNPIDSFSTCRPSKALLLHIGEEYYSSNTTSREAGGYAQCRDKGVSNLHQGVHGMCVECG
jgi:hypothetical protein